MWIHFDFECDKETQIRLHKIFRPTISDWKESRLIDGSVLTYHFHIPRLPTDSLYICLNILSVNLPINRSKLLSEETVGQIPEEIKNKMREICSKNLTNPLMDRLEIIDYEFEMQCNNAPIAYDGAPIEEILNFASRGTEIALEILDNPKTRNRTWRTDGEIADSINQSIIQHLTSDRERKWGWHFTCNPTFLLPHIESYLQKIANRRIDGSGYHALNFLYEIEETGNFTEACRHLKSILGLLS